MNNTAVELDIPATAEERVPAPSASSHALSETSAFVSLIERLAVDPRVDVDKLERLIGMQERILDRNAKAAYAAALAAMQPELPTINRGGQIIVYSKSDREFAARNEGQYPANARPQQSTAYARLEDIIEAIRAPMAKHGFSFSSRVDVWTDGRIKVTGILAHKDGHSEETFFPLPHDSSGSKNAVQAIGSSITYGRRYTLLALLNIASHASQDRDDDGNGAGEPPATIDADQIAHLEQLIRDTGSDINVFLKAMKANRIEDFTVDKYKTALGLFARKKSQMELAK